MKRLVVNLLTALSLLLFLATAALRLSGYRGSPSPVWKVTQPLTETRYGVSVSGATLCFDTLTPPVEPPPQAHGGFLGFGHAECAAYVIMPVGPNLRIGDVHSVFIPIWFVLLITALLPAARLIPLLRARYIIPPGHCRSCGYDLRASPNRCPECGALPG